jgi:hypothetical protein
MSPNPKLPQNAGEYWEIIVQRIPESLKRDFTWNKVQTQVETETPGILNFPRTEEGTREAIRWLASLEMPSELGLCDGTEYDTYIANIINGLQKVLADQGLPKEPAPANSPVAARLVTNGALAWREGGTNRAKAKSDAAYFKRKEEAKKANSTGQRTSRRCLEA